MGKIENLQILQELKENGSITEVEFELEKSKILNGNNTTKNKTESKNNKKSKTVLSVCLAVIIGIVIVIVMINMFAQSAVDDINSNREKARQKLYSNRIDR